MMALTTPAVVAIAVHWEVLCCLLLVMIVDVDGKSLKIVGVAALPTVMGSSCVCMMKIMTVVSNNITSYSITASVED